VHHAIKAVEIAHRQRANIADDLAIRLRHRLPGTAREQVEIAADDLVPALLQQSDQMRSDIAAVAGDQDLHVI
jgi:hypothetical protein